MALIPSQGCPRPPVAWTVWPVQPQGQLWSDPRSTPSSLLSPESLGAFVWERETLIIYNLPLTVLFIFHS